MPFYTSKYFILFFAIILLALIFERAFVGGNSWRYTHWLFDYDLGFIKRGLIGQLINDYNIKKSYINIEIIWSLVLFILYSVFMYIISRNLKKEGQTSPLFLFAFVALTSSATLQHFTYDFGRFDSINLILTMLLLLTIPKTPEKLLYIIIPVTSTVMVLIHEASFFLFIPLIISYWYFIYPTKLTPKLLSLIFVTIATFFIATQGKLESIDLPTHYALLFEKYGNNVSESSLQVLHRSLDQNLNFTMSSMDNKRLYDHIAFLITFLPLFIVFFKIFKKIFRQSETNISHAIVFVSCFSPLILYPLVEDQFRWWAIVITNLFMILSLWAHQYKTINQIIYNTFFQHKKLIFTSIILSMMLGPLGNPSAYPFTINQYFIHLFGI